MKITVKKKVISAPFLNDLPAILKEMGVAGMHLVERMEIISIDESDFLFIVHIREEDFYGN